MKRIEKNPRPITDANQIKDRVITEVSQANCLTVSHEVRTYGRRLRSETHDCPTGSATLRNEQRDRPSNENKIRGVGHDKAPKMRIFSRESLPFIEQEVQRRHPDESGKELVRIAMELGIFGVA